MPFDGERADAGRPVVRGKFLFSGQRKLYLRGVTYGTFRPVEDGTQFPDRETVARDFALMRAAGINAVRVYTVPPVWLLDLASEHELYVMVGLPWEQHITFLDESHRPASIEHRARTAVRSLGSHPAILCYVVGNEIPASIVRWHGRQRIERFIHRLYEAVKAAAPGALVTYVNYPTTEYLNLPFLDFISFNVYLETPDRLAAYLAQLQNLAGDKPLVMAEIGIDSYRNGVDQQAHTLAWQIQTVFAAGCAGAFIFAWTDEWYRGGHDIQDWDFGLTTRDRNPKPALEAVRRAFQAVPFADHIQWPKISVVVCTYNGARTLRKCLEGLTQLSYPDYEIIVVDDGSTDASSEIAQQHPVRLIRQSNEGLSSARNTGLAVARGEIIAYIDDDAWPDPHWLHYLAWTYMNTGYAAVGGPNIPPPEDGDVAACVANSPGGPAHVMISHVDAEHIPGCNCSFLTETLKAVGGFDAQFRTAGDDVDLCWRLLEHGAKIGFHAGAVVWHHRRRSVGTYLKQQAGYGRAEALLEAKWPDKYSAAGGVKWAGRVYGNHTGMRRVRDRIYYGIWGSAPFQRLYADQAASLSAVPGWHAVSGAVMALVAVFGEWTWLPLAAAPLLLPFILQFAHGFRGTAGLNGGSMRLRYRTLTALLHVVQPLARSWGRTSQSVRIHQRSRSQWVFPRRQVMRVWSEDWKSSDAWIGKLDEALRSGGGLVRRGGDFDDWDLEICRGFGTSVRVSAALEEHGERKQMLLLRLRPTLSRNATTLLLVLFALTVFSIAAGHGLMVAVPAFALFATALQLTITCGQAAGAACSAIETLRRQPAAADTVMQESVIKITSSLRKTGEGAA